jgi:hypothetical protein
MTQGKLFPELRDPVHLCHAIGCNVPVPPKMLMCKPHWYMVPPELRAAVWREYRKGQEIRKDPTRAYLVVMRQAIEAVAEKEGKR